MDSVAKNIYISSFHQAEDLSLLESSQVRAIVSVGNGFTPKFSEKGFQYHVIDIEDEETENALDHFDAVGEFIASFVNRGENVLVHCMAGVSRSATFVAAYLMQTEGIGALEAVDRIRVGRSCVCPNNGFMSQLEIYSKMGCKVEKNSAEYRRFLLSLAASEQQQLGTLTKLKMTADPTKQAASTTSRTIRCKSCRRPLLSEDSVIPHEAGVGQNAFQYRKRDTAIMRLSQQPKESACSSHCTEPMEWMTEVSDGHLEGKVLCPNERCGAKLGSFSWAGIACPCGTWVAPAFMINKQKVDIVGLVKSMK
ncbi:protein-tyrosine phosphatase-like protein [Chytriomyces sp. MP71]|nr:protein-tyrosine phosphatase-like protein [Chytriomyces sp. MP71]